MGSWVQIGGTAGVGLCIFVVLRWTLFYIVVIWSMSTKSAARRKHALALIGLLRRVGPPLPRLPRRSGRREAPDDTSDDA